MPQFNGVQDNFKFWQARVRAFLMEKAAHGEFDPTKEKNSTEDKMAAAAKACSQILCGLGDVPLAAVINDVDDRKKM